MKSYFLLKKPVAKTKEYIFIVLLVIILLLFSFSKSYSSENIFTVDNVSVQGKIEKNFSRNSYIDKAFFNSFKILMGKILLSSDFHKINDIKKQQIVNSINSFQIVQETFQKDKYEATFKIIYNGNRVKKLLLEKNISFSEPKKISAVFFPVLFIDDDLQQLSKNYFYNQWTKIELENESINFILPLDDLDDISKIEKMKNRIEDIEVSDLINKYNTDNYVFALLDYKGKKLNIHIKTNFDENKMSKNFSYNINDINDEIKVSVILKDLKVKINDIWKELNIVNLLMPLSIKAKFEYKELAALDKLRNTLYNVSIVDKYDLEVFDINSSIFKIYYYGNPKRLKSELVKFGYELKNDQGYWELYVND